MEHEPNGTLAQANPLELGRTTTGGIDPPEEEDYFTITIPAPPLGADPGLGRPNIRTSLTLFDAAGKSHKRFDPGAVPPERATFWAVAPGEHVLQVTEPPTSIVLIWDTSGSMKGSTEDLRRAVEAYRPGRRANS
jgi:hypothetical protein